MSGKVQKPKQKKEPQPPKTIPNKEGFNRASYLYQLSTCSFFKNYEMLSRGYSKNMDLILKKQVLKADPSIKRTICKKCDRLQVLGLTSDLMLIDEGKKSEVLEIRCLKCKNNGKKRFPVGKDRDHVLFSDKNAV